MTVPTVTVTGTYEDADGNPASGTVSFRLNTNLYDSEGNVIVTRDTITATLDGSGAFSQVLAATTGDDIEPSSGVVYVVTERIDGAPSRRYRVALPHTSPTVDLADVAPAYPSGLVWTEALRAADLGLVVLPAPTGTDDTDALNDALASAGNFRGRAGATYLISAPLVVPSGTTLDMTGCTVRLIAGSDCNMLQNEAVVATDQRDSNVTLRGGTWDRQNNAGTGTGLHSIIFRRCDGLFVHDLFVESTAGKYAVNVGDCTDFVVQNIHGDVASDLVHVNGPASQGVIRDIFGLSDDDTVSLTPDDYVAYADVKGPIDDVTIENVQASSSLALLKITGGYELSNVVARGLRQNGSGRALVIANDTGTLDITSLDIDGIKGRVQIASGGTVHRLSLRNLVHTPTANAQMAIENNGTVVTLSIDGARCDSPTYTDIPLVTVMTSATITNLNVRNAWWRAQSTNLVQLNAASSVLTNCRLSDIYHDGISASGSLVRATTSGMTLNRVYLSRVDLVNKSWLADLLTTTAVYLNGVQTPGGGFNVRSGGSVTVRGSGIDCGASANAGTLRSKSLDFPIAVDLLTNTANDLATNTKASLGCGTGPVVANGTAWKHLYTGSTT